MISVHDIDSQGKYLWKYRLSIVVPTPVIFYSFVESPPVWVELNKHADRHQADQQFSVVLYQEVELPFWKLYISLLQCYAIELQHVGILVVNCIDFIFSTIYGLMAKVKQEEWWLSIINQK